METFASVIAFLTNLFGAIRDWFHSSENADHKQAGRDDVAAEVNKETSDAQDRMAQVNERPTSDAVADSLSRHEF